MNIHWKDRCQSWNSNTLATWCEELTHLKRPWCWEKLKVEGEGDDRGWNGWMASLTQWTWVWVNSGSWWWTGRPGVLHSMGLQRVGHDWTTELNWTEERTIEIMQFEQEKKICISNTKSEAQGSVKLYIGSSTHVIRISGEKENGRIGKHSNKSWKNSPKWQKT